MGTIKKSSFFMRYALAISTLSLTVLSADVCKSYGNDAPEVTAESVTIPLDALEESW